MLDGLDAIDYSIRAVPESGVTVAHPVQRVDLAEADHDSIEFFANQ